MHTGHTHFSLASIVTHYEQSGFDLIPCGVAVGIIAAFRQSGTVVVVAESDECGAKWATDNGFAYVRTDVVRYEPPADGSSALWTVTTGSVEHHSAH